MSSTLKIRVRDLNVAFVREMQEKYANAELEITVHRPPNTDPEDEQFFWRVIDLLDWDNQGDNQAVIEPAVNYLATSYSRPG